MRVLTFQNYGILKEIVCNGKYISRVNREELEPLGSCITIQSMVNYLNNKLKLNIKNPVFGMTRINSKQITVEDIMKEILGNALDEFIGVKTLEENKVLLSLNVPKDKVVEYNQAHMNLLTRICSYNMDDDFDIKNRMYSEAQYGLVTSALMPCIEEKWIKGVYKLKVINNTLVLLETDLCLRHFKLVKALRYNNNYKVIDVTKELKGYN